MIKIEHLSKKFRDQQVLDDLSFTIEKGQVVAIIGSSGAGKPTLLRSINLLEEPEAGQITIDDFQFDVQQAKKNDVIELRKQTAMVFQQFNLFNQKTALENVMEGLTVVKKISKSEAEQLALEELRKVGMLERADFYPKHLSGGQKQRVAIARALAMAPKLLLLDEPTSALDPELVGEVLESIKKAAKDGNTMLLVSHEMSFVRHVADKIIFLDGGKIIEAGTPEQIFVQPQQERTRKFLRTYYSEREPEYVI